MAENRAFYGEKYDQLAEAKPIIESAGFNVPEMYGMPQQTLDELLHASSLPTILEADSSGIDPNDVEDQLQIPINLAEHILEVSRGLSTPFGGPSLIRSSGKGDAIGVGVYSSVMYSDNIDSVSRAFSEVVASYFRQEAINYRQRANISPGFAVFMQPMVGTVYEGFSHYQESGTAEIFDVLLSGNAKIGTMRSPQGSMKLQPGFGCAVAIPGLPSFEFNDVSRDYEIAEYEAAEIILQSTNARNRGADDAVNGRRYVNDGSYGWRQDYGEFYPKSGYVSTDSLTIGTLKERLVKIHEALGGSPTYYEFVVRQIAELEEIYIVQKGDIPSRNSHGNIGIDNARMEDILLSNIVVEAGNGNSPTFDTVVCLTDEDKSDLYEFDSSDEAKGGYLVAFGAQRSMKSNPINIRKLKNVKAIVTLESRSWSHTSSPEEHIAGYSEALGIPLISISSKSDEAWRLLNGYSYDEHISTGRQVGTLLVRDGSFQVVTDPAVRDGLILEFDRQN